MTDFKFYLGVGCILTASTVYANAAESLYDLSIDELMNVEVYSANKSNESVTNIPANVTVITRRDIEDMGYVTFDEIVRHLPGLFLIDTYRDQLVGTRGSVGGSFAFLINGVLSHPANLPAVRPDLRGRMNIPVESIDRIEFVRGPQAVTYGDSAFYGSINVVTNDADNNSMASVAGGDNGQQKQFGRYVQRFADGDLIFNLGHWQSDGIGGDLNTTLSPDQVASLHPQMRTSLDGLLAQDNYHFDFSGRYKHWYANVRYSDMEYGFYANTPSFDNGNTRNVVDQQATIGYQASLSPRWDYKIDYSYSHQTLDIDSFDFVLPTVDGYQTQEYSQHALDVHGTYTLNRNANLLVGVWYQTLDTEGENKVTNFNNAVVHVARSSGGFSNTDFYTQLNYSPIEKFNFNAGLRFSRSDSYTVVETDLLAQQITEFPKSASNEVLPQLGMVYHLDPRNSLKLLYGKANQKPLNPEIRDKDELIESLELQYQFSNDQLVFNSALFFNQVDNLARSTLRLEPDPANPGTTATVVRFDNSGELEVYGMELSFKHQLSTRFAYNASASYQTSEDVSHPGVEPGYSPRLLAKFDVTYAFHDFTYSLLANFVDSMKADWQYNNNNEVERIGADVDSYIDLVANLRYDFTRRAYGNLKVSNLLDEDIRYPATEFVNFYGGGLSCGRLFLLSLGYQF